jgi:hypothetical protein
VSDRINNVLAAIDAETAKCICGNDVPADGASLDYCSPACQYGYTGPRDSHRLGRGIPDGRTLNQQVAHSLATTIPAEEHYRDAMHEYAPAQVITRPAPPRVELIPPGSAELANAIDLTPFIVSVERAIEAFNELGAAARRPSIDLALVNQDGVHTEHPPLPEPEPPLAGGDLRQHALEHQQNRGTGPARPDNRRWRNR